MSMSMSLLNLAEQNRLLSKDIMEITESSAYSYCKEDVYKASWKQERLTTDCPISTQNKSISFQSSTENPFQEVENNIKTNVPEDTVLREVSNYKLKCEWPRDAFATDGDQKYFGKPWGFLESNFVTSPSFGMQTVYAENGLSKNMKMNDKNKNKGKTEKFERKDSEQVILGKVYGSTSLLKKKQWAPLLSKKS